MALYEFFIGMFILASFITRTIGGDEGLMSRIIVADLFGALALITYLFYGKKYLLNSRTTSLCFLLLTFGAGVLGSYDPSRSLSEVFILLFLVAIFITAVSHYVTSKQLTQLIITVAWASLIGATVGLYDSFIGGHGLPRIFPERARGEALSGFRNAGQAGAYMLITIIILFGFFSSKLFNTLNRKQRNIIRISLLVSFVFFITTGKVAAYIGMAVSFLSYFLYKRNVKVLVGASLVVLGIFYMINTIEKNSPVIYNRLLVKVQTRILEPYEEKENSVGSRFLRSNYASAIHSFSDNPLTASGIGGFMGRYGRYEVHSTYLKILGETGIIGVIGYLFFLFYFLKVFYVSSTYSKSNPFASYLKELAPLLLGCLVSWGYTYHLRKREFWILYFIVAITYFLMKEWETQQTSDES